MLASGYTISMVYPRRGLPLALELVNTQFALAGQPQDGLQTPRDLEAWFDANAGEFGELQLPAPSEAVLSRFRSLRAALRAIFTSVPYGEPPPDDAVAAFNAVLAAAPRHPRLDWGTTGPHVHWVDLADEPQTAALAAVARSALSLVRSEDAEATVGQCQAPGCVLFFLRDARRKHWCSAACGNRARVARHYLRQHGKNERFA